ncbi:TlpA disulfide reductase family protein [Agriterribacter sp.]|uniref:TlpA family protein disulfide reductase n=1 Tax=Agriterribacter sp. TaxID=2821509 RepID=UPI002B8B5ED5|nr:TlpA disulfide reductase family protein [Agriterribacter sp.]HRP57805.1 TlpA disulfide reductase family protein [Agriterribacter sp.]
MNYQKKTKVDNAKARNWSISIKRLIALSFLCSFLFCYPQNRKESNDIIFSGKITNVPTQLDGKKIISINTEFLLKGDTIYRKEIVLSDDGTFKVNISSGSGLYTLFDGTNATRLFLRKSKRYEIDYNTKFFKNGKIQLVGADTAINRYFVEKYQNRVFVDRDIKRSEEDYRQYLGNIKKQQLQCLERSKLPTKLKQEEAKYIEYEYLYELNIFLLMKGQIEPAFKPSKASRDELSINYSNEQEYKKQHYYASLVGDYYTIQKLSEIKREYKKKDSLYSVDQYIIKILDSLVPSQYIKNDLIRQITRFYLRQAKDKEAFFNDFKKYYTGHDSAFKQITYDNYLRLSKLKKGTPSPDFSNYQNFNGGSNSLTDFRGKYVFIDIWATWCAICWDELSYLKKLEKKHEGKNIVFVSLSWDKVESEWRKTIEKENLTGVQLLAKGKDDPFLKAFAVTGIPRYIFLDPDGKIIDYNAPRPSEKEKIQKLFNSAGL